MSSPDVLVTVEGGVAHVLVNRPGVTVEVRDYEVDGADDDDEMLWRDADGYRCIRYFVKQGALRPRIQNGAAKQQRTPPSGG